MNRSTLKRGLITSVLLITCAAADLAYALPQAEPVQLLTNLSAPRISLVFNATPLAEALRQMQAQAPITFEIANPTEALAPVSAVIDAKPVAEAIKLMLQGYGYVMHADPSTHDMKLVVYSAPVRPGVGPSAPDPARPTLVQAKNNAPELSDDDEESDD